MSADNKGQGSHPAVKAAWIAGGTTVIAAIIAGAFAIFTPYIQDFLDDDEQLDEKTTASQISDNIDNVTANNNVKENNETQLSYVSKLADYISGGGIFSIRFYQESGDDICGDSTKTGYLGNFMAGKAYTVYYIPATHNWVTEGPLQQYPGCGLHKSINDRNFLPFDKSKRTMNLWAAEMHFDESGEVYWGPTRVGIINNPF